MNGNLYRKELKRNRRNLFIWSAIVIGLTVVVMSIFPYMKTMGEEMATMMSKLPEGMTKAMGLNAQTFNNILGMYNTYYGIYIVVLLSIYAASTGATIVSKEERDKTAEFLLTKPISRKTIFLTKMGALFTLAFAAFLLQTLTALICVLALSEALGWSVFVTMHTHGLVLMLFFACVGVLSSMWANPKRGFMGMVVGIVFGSYFLNTIAKVADSVNWLGYFSPFHYLDFEIMSPDYSVNYVHVAVIIALSLLMLLGALRIYEGKNIGA